MDALLRDDRLRWDLAQLAATLDQLLPERPRPALPLQRRRAARASKARCAQMAQLQRWTRSRSSSTAIDGAGRPRRRRPRRGARAAGRRRRRRTSTRSRTSPRRSRTAGYPERDGDRLELTPRGSRRHRPEGARRPVREAAPRRVRRPSAAIAPAAAGSATETTKPYEFGDPFHLDLQRTLGNALHARGERARGARAPGDGRLALHAGGLRGLPDRAD